MRRDDGGDLRGAEIIDGPRLLLDEIYGPESRRGAEEFEAY